MTRREHLDWCKGRALEYVEAGQLHDAYASIISDLAKYDGPELYPLSFISILAHDGLVAVVEDDAAGVRRWIEGFG